MDPEDVVKCEERYNKAKAVHSVMRYVISKSYCMYVLCMHPITTSTFASHVAEQHGMKLETLYQNVGWPLYKKYGHAYDAFRLALK